jgi:predicted DNA binding CopG/RHH family protein
VISIKEKNIYTMKKNLKVPKFKNEDQEREFWAKVDLSAYFEPADFEKTYFSNLKPTSHAISIRVPDYLLVRLKERANEINVPYHSLIKGYIAEGMVRDQGDSVYKA